MYMRLTHIGPQHYILVIILPACHWRTGAVVMVASGVIGREFGVMAIHTLQ